MNPANTIEKTKEVEERHNTISLSVLSSSQITNRASIVIKHLTFDQHQDGKQPLCRIRAKAKVASKLITIVEIAKRDLVAKGVKVYQYTSLTSEMVTMKPKSSDQQADSNAAADGQSSDVDEPDAFQTMREKETVRAIPVMTVYLSTKPIKELKLAYG